MLRTLGYLHQVQVGLGVTSCVLNNLKQTETEIYHSVTTVDVRPMRFLLFRNYGAVCETARPYLTVYETVEFSKKKD